MGSASPDGTGSGRLVGAVFAPLSSGATLLALSATGTLQSYAAGSWVNDLLAGRTALPPTGMLIATPPGCSSRHRRGRGERRGHRLCGRRRARPVDKGRRSIGCAAAGRCLLRSRWSALLSTVGLALFVVPGVFAYLVLVLAGPVVMMERAPLPARCAARSR